LTGITDTPSEKRDTDSTELWTTGKFVQAAGRINCVADAIAPSESVGGTSLTAYPTHAEGIVADECAVIAGGE
jgi:hypothetical protein